MVKKTEKVSKVSKVKEEKSVPVSTPVPVPVVPDPTPVPVSNDIEYTQVLNNLIEIDKLVKTTMPLIKKLQKQHERDIKNAEKSRKHKRTRNPDAPPSGFARPGPVSDELRNFLGLGKNELIARTQVAKRVSEYIKEQGLKNPDNNKEIIIDKKLATLFKVDEKSKIEFFKIQSYLTSHFLKAKA